MTDDNEPTADELDQLARSLAVNGPLGAVQAVLGHASPAETLDVYTHFWPSDEEKSREAIERASLSWVRQSM